MPRPTPNGRGTSFDGLREEASPQASAHTRAAIGAAIPDGPLGRISARNSAVLDHSKSRSAPNGGNRRGHSEILGNLPEATAGPPVESPTDAISSATRDKISYRTRDRIRPGGFFACCQADGSQLAYSSAYTALGRRGGRMSSLSAILTRTRRLAKCLRRPKGPGSQSDAFGPSPFSTRTLFYPDSCRLAISPHNAGRLAGDVKTHAGQTPGRARSDASTRRAWMTATPELNPTASFQAGGLVQDTPTAWMTAPDPEVVPDPTRLRRG